MKCSIITPTFRRPESLMRAIESVRTQAHLVWEMIIVNDAPGDGTCARIAALGDARIRCFEMAHNTGANAARNRGLEAIAPDSERVIFLDDDDYLAPEALTTLAAMSEKNPTPWLVTARGTTIHSPTTKGSKTGQAYQYLRDYLVYRRFQGDATHCLDSRYVNGTIATLRFPAIRNGEEWLFYATLGTQTLFYYEPIVTTLTDGYSATGLNNRHRGLITQLQSIPHLIREGRTRRLTRAPLFWVYILMRCARAFIKHS